MPVTAPSTDANRFSRLAGISATNIASTGTAHQALRLHLIRLDSHQPAFSSWAVGYSELEEAKR